MRYFSLGSISKNLGFLVIIAVLPALAILLYTGIEQRHHSIDHAEQNVLLLAHSMAQVQEDITKSCRQILSTLALLPAVQSLDPKTSSEIFAAVLKENPDFHNIALSDLNGMVLASGKAFKATSLIDRRHFQGALKTKTFSAGEYTQARIGDKIHVFPFAFPVLDEESQLKAVLTTVIDLRRFTRFHELSSLPEKSFIAATDHQGVRLLYFPTKENTNPVGKPIKSDVWEIAKAAQKPGIFFQRGSDGTRQIFAFEPLRLTPESEPYMYMWAGTPEARTLELANTALTRNLVIMLIATGVALFIAWALGRNRVIIPIQNLVEMTRSFAKGELNQTSQIDQPDEFGTLTRAFHDMAAKLSLSQTALQENEARFRLVMDSLDAVVYVADMDSCEILFINKYGRNTFGDIAGKTCWKTVQKGQDGPCDFCTNQYLLDENGQPGESYTWEFQNTITGRWYFIHDRAIKWVDGRIVRLEIATDINDRKLAETKLAEESERLAVTLRSIGDGVITTDIEGRIILINQIAETLTGWSNEQASGQPLNEVFKIVDARTGQPFESPFNKLLAGKTLGQTEQTTLIDKKGLKKRISDSGAPIKDKTGKNIGVVLVFRDISEQLRTEQELIKIKKLESVGVLAGGIAHDFNNILAAILGNIELSLRDTSLSEKSARRLKQARTASLRARDLTQQLLTFSKGGQPIKEAASLTEVVQESAEFSLRGGAVACTYDFPADLWLADIDKGQISQVIQNIIINASNAMPNGGQIEISGKNISSTEIDTSLAAETQHYVKLDIKDTGVGIPANMLDKIFDPYFTTKQKGSGLGLAITHSIIDKHGGSISVQSTHGVGSCFSIYLPASLQNSLPIQKITECNFSTKKARILVMDDEEIVRNIAQEMLTEMGHEVMLAIDGTEALQFYQEAMASSQPIDLIIMDLTIPGGMGGKEAVQQVLAVDSSAQVIVSSGYSNDPIMANFSEYGFCAAIVKPYQLDDLKKIIHQSLG